MMQYLGQYPLVSMIFMFSESWEIHLQNLIEKNYISNIAVSFVEL